MAPKKTSGHARGEVPSAPMPEKVTIAEEFSYFRQYPNIRRFLVVIIFLIIVGVPCPPQFFYSVFIAHSTWLRVFHRMGVFSDAIFMCEQGVGLLYSHDHEYYNKFQSNFNLTDADMFSYLQQWMCLMPPDNYDEFISDTLLKYAELVQDSELFDDRSFRGGLGMENYDLDAILQQKAVSDQEYINERIINSVYQEVESEPLHL